MIVVCICWLILKNLHIFLRLKFNFYHFLLKIQYLIRKRAMDKAHLAYCSSNNDDDDDDDDDDGDITF
jgi:hypothetical protein